ncbi:MAG TPA: MBL fold metallo-hydrolase [Candidatus Limnocylindrales bacterium]|nr:MBL fold metallo-hydrolase [Candidatus Limnocylindrales bacterium]
MLTPVADGVFVHQSELLQNNTVVVQGRAGVLLVDPGITGDELACLVADLRALGQPVVAGFATHPDWDHALWVPGLGNAPRYGTADCAAALRELLAAPDWPARRADALPPEIADAVPMDLFGHVTGLPAGTTGIPWDGPRVRLIEHPGHARGHAALLVEEARVLIAGDMLSDILVPFPDLDADDPVGDYLVGLDRLEEVVDEVDVVVPGHGSVGRAGAVHARIELDRAYVEALRDGRVQADPRIGPDATFGRDWLPDVAAWQAHQIGGRP